jgi:hypothetical protein
VRLPRLARLALALCCALAFAPAVAARSEPERVDLVPEDRASWRLSNVLSFLRPGHYFGERSVRVETTPPGSRLDLYYVRAGFQKRYEQAEAPAILALPRRVDASPRDVVRIRAIADGYRYSEITVRVHDSQDRVLIELDPLPNNLHRVAHVYLAGRASLTLLTDEVPEARFTRSDAGFSLILNQTAKQPGLDDTIQGIQSPLVESVRAQQLGEDLMLRVALASNGADPQPELRLRQGHDAIRALHRFSVDFVPPDGGASAVSRAHEALARIETRHVSGCAAVFDRALREALDRSALTRALAPQGEFTDPYLRAAMERLGEVSPGGTIELLDGSRYRSGIPLELSAAVTEAWQAKGFLALLRAFVAGLEAPADQRSALRSLVAPETGQAEFDALLDRAEAAERACEA